MNNLTLTYGLRYSYLQVPAETSGTQVGTCQFSGKRLSALRVDQLRQWQRGAGGGGRRGKQRR